VSIDDGRVTAHEREGQDGEVSSDAGSWGTSASIMVAACRRAAPGLVGSPALRPCGLADAVIAGPTLVDRMVSTSGEMHSRSARTVTCRSRRRRDGPPPARPG
jgi:hypothetical protein